MSFHHLDQFAGTDSPVTRAAPALRLIAMLAIAIGSATLPDRAWIQSAVFIVLCLTLIAMSRVPVHVVARRILPPLIFVIVVSVAVVVLTPGQTLATISVLHITDEGVSRFASIITRAIPSITAAVLLVSTTRFPELLNALRTLHLPEIVASTIALAYRFLYLLTDEIERITRAARSRNMNHGVVPRRRLMVGIASIAVQRSFARSERVYDAMLSRGYKGTMPALQRHRATPAAIAGTAIIIGICIVTVVSAYVTTL